MSKNPGKGSAYERRFCKDLSLWWSNDHRDDIFWRSQTSGGRATQRAKSNQTTHGQYGDVASTHPRGDSLLKFMTIELKNGYQKNPFCELIDFPNWNVDLMWEKWIAQARRSKEQSGSESWMIVHQRTGRHGIVCVPIATFVILQIGMNHLNCRLPHTILKRDDLDLHAIFFRLEDFWAIDSKKLREMLEPRKVRKKKR